MQMESPWMIEVLMIALLVWIAFRYHGPAGFYLLMQCLLFAALGLAVLLLT